MSTISKERLSCLPSGFQGSIIERSRIHAAIYNANTFIKYAKTCKKNHIETGDSNWTEYGLNSLMPYYKELLNVEGLAYKYSYLRLEKFCKCKLQAEKLLSI